MMKISTKGQYALLIMTDLAEMDNGKFISLKTLSVKHNLSVKYLEQILSQLSKSGLVTGLRGNNGGYKLTKKASEYTTGEILRALEGDLAPLSAGNTNQKEDSYGNNTFWEAFEKNNNDYVDSVSLEALVLQNKQNIDYDWGI